MATGGRRLHSLQWQMLIGFLVGLVLGLIANAAAGDAAWVEWISTYVTGPIGHQGLERSITRHARHFGDGRVR